MQRKFCFKLSKFHENFGCKLKLFKWSRQTNCIYYKAPRVPHLGRTPESSHNILSLKKVLARQFDIIYYAKHKHTKIY